jgi:hypothetical protein
MPTPQGFTAILANFLQNAARHSLQTGTLSVLPTDNKDRPITATAGGLGGAISTVPVEFAIFNGTLGPADLPPEQTWRGPWNGAGGCTSG